MDVNNSNSDTRSRNWCAVVYPESLPEHWEDILIDTNVSWCHSPLHDKDIDGDNQPKKAHYHILLKFNSKKSSQQVEDVLAPLNCPRPQKCLDLTGSVRYMAHLDSPHKYQYSVSEIVGFNGFDVAMYIKASASERHKYMGEMIDFIVEHDIKEFIDFFYFCERKRTDTWFPLICDNCAIPIREAIRSNRHRASRSYVDYDTGEVLLEPSFDSSEEGASLDDE